LISNDRCVGLIYEAHTAEFSVSIKMLGRD